jgi:hypothetical protein
MNQKQTLKIKIIKFTFISDNRIDKNYFYDLFVLNFIEINIEAYLLSKHLSKFIYYQN